MQIASTGRVTYRSLSSHFISGQQQSEVKQSRDVKGSAAMSDYCDLCDVFGVNKQFTSEW